MKLLVPFLRHSLKYFLILGILICMIIPLLLSAFLSAKNQAINQNYQKLKDGMNAFEAQLLRAQEISDYIKKTDEFEKLYFITGIPSSDNYIYMQALQNDLSNLILTQEMSNVYLIFKNNPIFISNYISSSDKDATYFHFFNYNELSLADWNDTLFTGNSSTKFLYSSKIFSAYYNDGKPFEGVTYLINNSYNSAVSNNCILACVFNGKDILNQVMYTSRQSDSFVYLLDSGGSPIYLYRHAGKTEAQNIKNGDTIRYGSQTYVLLTYTTSRLGLTAVTGIPIFIFNDSIRSLLSLTILYITIGILVIIVLSLFFSMKETVWFRRLIHSAAETTHTDFDNRNEYRFLDDAIRRISLRDAEQTKRIESLNTSIQTARLRNILIGGGDADNDGNDLEDLRSKIEFYYVAVINCMVTDENNLEKKRAQYLIAETGESIRASVREECILLHLYSDEYALVVFLRDENSCSMDTVKSDYIDVIRAIIEKFPLKVKINIGLSNIMCGISTLRAAYQQARYAINANENLISSGVYNYGPTAYRLQKKIFDIAELQNLYDAILAGDKETVMGIFDRVNRLLNTQPFSGSEQIQMLFSLRQTISNTLFVIESKEPEKASEHLFLPEIHAMQDFPLAFAELKNSALQLCGKVSNNKKSNNEKLKSNILAYINEQYSDPGLSAYTIGEHFLVSEKYIFFLVKDHTGKALNKYIESIRLEKAEQMLAETGLSNADILKACGFGSENTFYRAFTKKHAVSPSQWRKSRQDYTD